MTTIRYIWKDTSGEGDSKAAQAIGERLAEIEKDKGQLKADFVVEDARSENSVLHKYFEWDDSRAAHQHRLHQARHLISHIHVKVIDDKTLQKPTRAFVNIRVGDSGDDKIYENVVSVMSDELKRKRLLAKARQEFVAWRNRYQDLEELSNVIKAFDDLDAV